MISADGHKYTPMGYGILHVPATTPTGYLPLFCYHKPRIRSTILSPRSIKLLLAKCHVANTSLHKFLAPGSFIFTVHHKLQLSEDIMLSSILVFSRYHAQRHSCKWYLLHRPYYPSLPVSRPFHLLQFFCPASCSPSFSLPTHGMPRISSHTFVLNPSCGINDLDMSVTTICIMLTNISMAYIVIAHQDQDPVLDQCPTCLPSKLKKRAPSRNTTPKATIPWQALSINLGSTGQQSKNPLTMSPTKA